MTIKAIDVKKLREDTNAGMMDCKKALIESDGDFEKAKTILKEKGQSKADSKSGRTTAQGLVVIKSDKDFVVRSSSPDPQAVILEVNCETDFAAKDEFFIEFVNNIAFLILERDINNMEQLVQESIAVSSADQLDIDNFENIEEYRKFAISKLGENITIRRFQRVESNGTMIGTYVHGTKIASIVEIDDRNTYAGDDAELAKDVAMHVAASKPEYISNTDIPDEIIKEESRILTLQAEEEGKPKEIIGKIVAGKLKKQFDQVTLNEQEFVKDPDMTISQLLSKKNTSVYSFIRYEVGEGIEIEEANFADEVKAQVDALK
mgnify:FL=1